MLKELSGRRAIRNDFIIMEAAHRMNKREMPLKRNGLERMFGHLMAMEVRRIFDLSISMCVFK